MIFIVVSDCNEICVIDKDFKCVCIFLECGVFFFWYDGGIGMEFLDFYYFLLFGLCYDSEGNIFVVNFLDGIIYVLVLSGDFKGYI